MTQLSDFLSAYTPTAFDPLAFWKVLLLFCGVCLGLSILGHLLGKRSSLHHALSCSIGILFLYLLGTVLYCLNPEFHRLLSCLPFIDVPGDYLVIFPIQAAPFSDLCTQILRMVILTFLVTLLESRMPQGKNVVIWLLLKLSTVILALVLQYVLFWLLDAYLPELLVIYAPAILVVLLVLSILIGALKLIVGLFLATVNPVIAALYAFFFVNKTGRLLSKSVLSAILLTGVVYGLNALGYTVISITAAALTSFLPAVVVLLLMWYVVYVFL